MANKSQLHAAVREWIAYEHGLENQALIDSTTDGDDPAYQIAFYGRKTDYF